MRRFLSLVLVVAGLPFFAGCSQYRLSKAPDNVYMVSLDELLKKYGFSLDYKPFYENVTVENSRITLLLKPGYKYVLFNNNPKNLHREVSYRNGILLIPSTVFSLLDGYLQFQKKTPLFFSEVPFKTIVVDPGHGGKDPGAVSPWGLQEKYVNLKIAKMLRSRLRKAGFKVYLTRESDRFVSLQDRVEFARRKKADLFISIHANANRSGSVRGFEVYYPSPRFTDNQSRMLALSENMLSPGEKNKSSLKTLSRNFRDRGRKYLEISSLIIDSAEAMGIVFRRAKGAPFYVLKHNVCPAVLVEAGYLTNYKEAKMLSSGLYQRQIAFCVAQAVSRLRSRLRKFLVKR